ncbi:hypothetical protein NEOLEDRAFT_1152821 [Neolentinus lepideus HHB14362 ss-1]|uniref:Uncharacterized protein n=1 Tax=Neolentinus lepideus HHB14362 ss-1 TaxID=1314782 RepID=A0A165M8X9_9AGAM|nr:hypothetical protein NEOLEDRAFT_1152821 [Neolentinus lepideus HHB14362 ss-1]
MYLDSGARLQIWQSIHFKVVADALHPRRLQNSLFQLHLNGEKSYNLFLIQQLQAGIVTSVDAHYVSPPRYIRGSSVMEVLAANTVARRTPTRTFSGHCVYYKPDVMDSQSCAVRPLDRSLIMNWGTQGRGTQGSNANVSEKAVNRLENSD